MPKCCLYQVVTPSGSLARKNSPPIPVTGIACSSERVSLAAASIQPNGAPRRNCYCDRRLPERLSMSSPDEARLIAQLTDAQRHGTHGVDATPYSTLDRAAAYRVQSGVRLGLGRSVGMVKTGIHSDSVGVVAPIYADAVGRAPAFRLPQAN